MKTLTKNLILFVSITLSFCQLIHAQETEKFKRHIEFVTSNEFEILDPNLTRYMEESIPTHIAVVEFTRQMRIPSLNMKLQSFKDDNRKTVEGRNGTILCYGFINDNSLAQLKLLKFMCLAQTSDKQKVSFFAASEKQAKEIAQAYIKCMDDEIDNLLNDLKHDLETQQKIITEGDVKIPKMEFEYEDLIKQKNVLYKQYAQVNYLNEEMIPDINDIVKVKDELAHSLREADFELVGLDAKIGSINKYKLSGTVIDNETLIKLNQILITTDIERAGIFARKQAFETSLKQTNQLYDLILSSQKAENNLKYYKDQFNKAPQRISELKMKLENPSEYYRYAEITDNKIIIKPIKFEK